MLTGVIEQPLRHVLPDRFGSVQADGNRRPKVEGASAVRRRLPVEKSARALGAERAIVGLLRRDRTNSQAFALTKVSNIITSEALVRVPREHIGRSEIGSPSHVLHLTGLHGLTPLL
jgi:hypothetical protein